MKDCNGEELIALAGVISVQVAKGLDLEELTCFTEFLGLLKHHLDIIKIRRFIKKVEKKVEEKREEKKEEKKATL